MSRQVRTFDTGANRDSDSGKFDFEGFLSPLVLTAFARYMHSHRTLADGSQRPADNWQKGMPEDAYVQSLLRHVVDLWLLHRGHTPVRPEDGQHVEWDDALGGAMFNVQGLWFERLTRESP